MWFEKMSFLNIFNHEIYSFFMVILVTSSGVHCELCNIIDDQGGKDKIYCKIGCCGPLEDSHCCVEDDEVFSEYYYGYRVAGSVVGFIIGLLAAVVFGRCVYAICRDRTIYVTTIEPGAAGGITVVTSGEVHAGGNIPMQRPATISYSEDNSCADGLPILYHDQPNNDQQRLVK